MIPHKTALITAACSDVGAKVARQLDQQGYHLILLDADKPRVEALAEELYSAIAVVSDLTQADDLHSFCELIALQSPALDLAFINSVIIYPSAIEDLRHVKLNQMLEKNFWITLQLIKACATNMERQRSGHIIASTSLQGVLSAHGNNTYLTSKIGLRGFLSGVEEELKRIGIKVSGIYPGGPHISMVQPEKETQTDNSLNFNYQPAQIQDLSQAFFEALSTGKLEIYTSHSGDFLLRFKYFIRELINSVASFFIKPGNNRQDYL